MKASELIELLTKKCRGGDPDIKFLSYEWDDDLEDLSYHERWFESVHKEKDKICIYVSR